MKSVKSDFLVIGSGPGGATVARQLAQAGQKVLLLERGRDWRKSPLYGTYPGAMLYTDKFSFLNTKEGLNIIRPFLLGGATSMYCACAALPLPWWKEGYNIDLNGYAKDTVSELHIAPLPAELRGPASTRIAAAALAVGQKWVPQDKFMSPARASQFKCRATCMLGCRCGAKWHAAEYVDEAVVAGCQLWTKARVDKLLIENGHIWGAQGKHGHTPFIVQANHIIVAAGGIGSAKLLLRSGLAGAGQGMTMDSTVMVYGHAPYKGNGHEPPMTWSFADDELGVLFSTLIDPWLNYPVVMMHKGPAYSLRWHEWGRTLGVMIKLKDEISGQVPLNGRISKGLTTNDQQRLKRAQFIAEKILMLAGCTADSIYNTPVRGTHPSGTVRIGEMLTPQLETEIKGLYVCDASVFPEALARPIVLTIISLAKRLANKLISEATAVSPTHHKQTTT